MPRVLGLVSPPDLSEEAVATRLGWSIETLRRYRWRGEGPAYLKYGRCIRYRPSDVDAWLDSQRVDPQAAS